MHICHRQYVFQQVSSKNKLKKQKCGKRNLKVLAVASSACATIANAMIETNPLMEAQCIDQKQLLVFSLFLLNANNCNQSLTRIKMVPD